MVHVERAERPEQPTTEASRDSGELLNMAVQHHQAGRLEEADGLYRLLLDVEPEHPDALHLSGLIRLARYLPGDAIAFIERAIAGLTQ